MNKDFDKVKQPGTLEQTEADIKRMKAEHRARGNSPNGSVPTPPGGDTNQAPPSGGTGPSGFAFIPKPLKIDGRPELEIFPLNVVFGATGKKDDRVFMARARYEPDTSSFRKDGDKCSLLYKNAYGGDGHLRITYDTTRGSYEGEKFIGGVSDGLSFGIDWNRFFTNFTMLGLVKGEACLFEDVPTPGS